MKLLLENWREYLKKVEPAKGPLDERQSIPLSPSVREWVNNSYKAYRSVYKEGSLKPDQAIFSDHIEGYDGEKILVTLVTKAKKNMKSSAAVKRYDSDGDGAPDFKDGAEVMLYVLQKSNGTWTGLNDRVVWIELMMHELTHVVDPKARLDPDVHPAGRSYKFGTEEYYTSDIEVDGYIRSAIEELNQWGPDGFGGPWTKEDVRNFKPNTPEQKIWYEKYPKIWRKLINALYYEVEG